MNFIFAVNIENFSEVFKEGLHLVLPLIQQDVLRFKFEKDRHRKLVSVLLLRFLIKNFLNLYTYNVSTNAFGKPYLKSHPGFQFNLSHSGNWVVAAISDKPLGIDVEQISVLNDFMDIAKRFYSEKEYAFLIECEEKIRLSLFYDIWTKKESLIKAIGKGLSIPLKSFTVPFVSNGSVDYKGNNWSLCSLAFNDKDYKVSICFFSEQQFFAPFKNITLDELVNK
jgi:4'-phosphopantetheinyl transferase